MFRKVILLLVISLLALGAVVHGDDSEDQAITLSGLDGEVSVHYDSYGIPHIYATTPHDLFMVQGYITAQDRWWQMEWSRRQARGELSSIMGEKLVDTDIALRTLGLLRNAKHDIEIIDPEMMDVLQAYADGVNAWLADKSPSEAAIEYNFIKLFGSELEPEPWTPLDTLTFAQAVALSFEQEHLEAELLKGGLIQAGGPLAPLLLMPPYDYAKDPLISEPGWQPATVSQPVEVAMANAPDLSNFKGVSLPWFMQDDAGGGSNSWVISGDLTTTGKPLLANDPHIGQNQPAVWYEVGLHCVEVSAACPFDIYGYVFPGAPGIVIGHNAQIAWGMTVSALDTVDVYTIQVNPDNPLQYMFNGEWTDMEIITETIAVAGGDPVEAEIRMTHFGPIVNDFVGIDDPIMAARIGSATPSKGIQMFYYLTQATNWDEFQAAVANFDIAGQNVVFADVEGNIGVVSAGRIPIRVAGHDGTTPMDGTTDQYDWQGFLDPSENPRLYNPPSGYIVAANNAFVRPEDFPVPFASYYDYGMRAARIETLIQASPKHSVDSVINIQTDTFNPAAAVVMPVLSTLDMGDVDLNAARDWLALDWDMHNDADSGQAALFNAFWLHLMPLAFDELDPAGGVSGDSHQIYLMRGMILGDHPLWKNEKLNIADRDEILKLAFENGYEMMVELQGDNPDTWRWDAVHYAYTQHVPLGQVPGGTDQGLDIGLNDILRLFNRKIGVNGGTGSVNNQRWDAREGSLTMHGASVSMRMIVDFSDFDNSRFVHPLGQSGDPFSPHYDDMNSLWATGQYHAHGYTADAVDAMTEYTVTFAP